MTGSPAMNWRNREARYRLVASQCPHCGAKHFPPRTICYDCPTGKTVGAESIRLKGTGEVLTFTVVHDAQKDFKLEKPYVMALIRLDEGLNVMGQIVDVEAAKVENGMKVRAVFRKLGQESPEGVLLYGNKWTRA